MSSPGCFRTPDLTPDDRAVLAHLAAMRRDLRFHVAAQRRWTGVVRRTTLAKVVAASNSIEGYHASVEDTAAIISRDAPLDTDHVTEMAIAGYRDAMTYVLAIADDADATLDPTLLRSLHFMLVKHDLDARPGRYRAGPVFVQEQASGRVVHEGADVGRVPALVERCMARVQDGDEPPLVAGAMVHLDLVMVHPFKDGNGRAARVLQSLAIARDGILAPPFCSIEEQLGRDTKAYYDVLAEVGGGAFDASRDATPWLRFCLDTHHRQLRVLQRRLEEAAHSWSMIEELVERRGVPERSLPALLESSSGRRLTNAAYRALADVNDHTASRDLARLVEADLLTAVGERRGRRYEPAPELAAIHAEVSRDRPTDLARSVYDVVTSG